MEKRLNEILSVLPSSWTDIKLNHFIKISAIPINEEGVIEATMENTINLISILSGATVDELEEFPMSMIAKLNHKIAFIYTEPEIQKESQIKWKTVNEITYGDIVVYDKHFKGNFNNIHLVIKAFSKEPLTEEQILDMNMLEIHSAFFFLKLSVQKFITDSQTSLINKFKDRKVKKILQHHYKVLQTPK